LMDSFFGVPFMDKDEWRDRPYRHRYVHGGFQGTDTRFAFYFPEATTCDGRFIQFLQGGRGGNEHQGLVMGGLEMAAENKAFYVESNQGHIGNDMSGLKGDISIMEWRASAQSARYARDLAQEMYGLHPHHGYIFGGSGGAMRSVNCLENAPEIWQGAVPFMINRAPLINYHWSISAWAGTILGDKIKDIVDAVDAGGSGNPFAVLETDAQRQALAALYRAGYCRGAESQLEPNPLWILGMQIVFGSDPGYFRDFWTKAGYEGFQNEKELKALQIREKGVVRELKTARDLAAPGMFEDINAGVLGRMPGDMMAGAVIDLPGDPNRLLGATLRLTSGKAQGRRMICTGAIDRAVVAILDPVGFLDVDPGDTIETDNQDFTAFLFYHRHLVHHRYPTMGQFLVDGHAIYEQRSIDLEAIPVPSGKFTGKMILLQHVQDRECWPICAEPYIQDVKKELGGRKDQNFRIWWIENAAHLVPLNPAGQTRLINYSGCFSQALRDVIAWVEKENEPPSSTAYQLEDSGKLILPAWAPERRGIQPVVSARANDLLRAEVKVGEEVTFKGVAEAPPGSGSIVRVEWDFDGSGSFPLGDSSVDGTKAEILTQASHVYEAPGTYMATLRVFSQREGRVQNRLRMIPNLARVRVIVRDT
jgi:hypothetical protein